MVLVQSYDSPPGLSIESAREAGKGLPGVGRLTECAECARGFSVCPVGAAVPQRQTIPMRASFLEALCLDLRNERQTGGESEHPRSQVQELPYWNNEGHAAWVQACYSSSKTIYYFKRQVYRGCR